MSETPGYDKPRHQYGQPIDHQCPDGGTCHHMCSGPQCCFRVQFAGPLSGVYENDEWPAGVKNAHLPTDGVL